MHMRKNCPLVCRLIAFIALASAQQTQSATLFNATGSPAATEPTVHYLQQITLPAPNEFYIITGFSSLGLATSQPDGPRCQAVINFYTDLDLSPGSTDVLAGATLIGSQVYNVYLPVSPAVIGINFDTPFVAPRTFAVEIALLNEEQSAYSDLFQGRFTLTNPTVGTSPGYVWSDVDRDNHFFGAEQTTFGSAVANIRMTVVGVPGPRINTLDFANGQPRVTFTTVSGRNYRVERKAGLTGFSWSTVTGASSVAGNGGSIAVSDPDTTNGAAFYRVIML